MKILKIENNIGAIALDIEAPGNNSYLLANKIISHNSMKGILEQTDESTFIERQSAPKRPESLPCDIHSVTVKGKQFTILVGKLNGTVYEVFADDNHIDINKFKTGLIHKAGKGKYNLVIDGEELVIENLAKSFNRTYGTLTRLISMSLRHSTPLEFVVSQLTKGEEFVSFEKAIARVLKKYIKSGEVKISVICESCKSTHLVYTEGCISCKDCGWSKCD